MILVIFRILTICNVGIVLARFAYLPTQNYGVGLPYTFQPSLRLMGGPQRIQHRIFDSLYPWASSTRSFSFSPERIIISQSPLKHPRRDHLSEHTQDLDQIIVKRPQEESRRYSLTPAGHVYPNIKEDRGHYQRFDEEEMSAEMDDEHNEHDEPLDEENNPRSSLRYNKGSRRMPKKRTHRTPITPTMYPSIFRNRPNHQTYDYRDFMGEGNSFSPRRKSLGYRQPVQMNLNNPYIDPVQEITDAYRTPQIYDDDRYFDDYSQAMDYRFGFSTLRDSYNHPLHIGPNNYSPNYRFPQQYDPLMYDDLEHGFGGASAIGFPPSVQMQPLDFLDYGRYHRKDQPI